METILLIDNYDSFTFNLVHYIEGVTNKKIDVIRNDQLSLKKVSKYDTIIISPGPGLPKDAGIIESVVEHFGPTKKILGVCLGMQAIGEVYGAKLLNMENVYHGISSSLKIIDINDPIFLNVPNNIQVGRYHSWTVSSKNFPKVLSITSEDKNNSIMSIKHKSYQVYGVQFHPESVLTEYGKEMIANFLAI